MHTQIRKRDIKSRRLREMSSSKEAVVPSDLFPHVYAFLVECNLTKAAKSLKKECKVVSFGLRMISCLHVPCILYMYQNINVLNMQPFQTQKGPGLMDFYQYYQTRYATTKITS